MKKAKLFMMLALLVMGVSNLFAQNVTVHPGNGNMLPALKAGNTDTFFGWGGNATWKHEQLSLTLTTGDSDNNDGTDEDGQLARPANDIFASNADTSGKKYLQIGKGNYLNTYLTVSLPKGYRFTGYTITFHRISSPNGATGGVNNYNGNISFGETNDAFTYRTTTNTSDNNITPYRGGIGQNNSNQYTIGRTSNTVTDMGNVLYFMLYNGAVNGRAFIQLDHMELYFTAENNYTPLIPAPNVTNQSAVDIPFTTSKMDYGTLTRYDINGNVVTGNNGRVSYDGTIHDMNANLILYESGSVENVADNGFDGTAGNIVKYQSGSISQAGDHFKLDVTKHGSMKGDTAIYFIESPIWAVNTASTKKNKNPIGYRIIGASFECTGGNVDYPAVFKIQYESTGHGADQDGTYGLNFYNNSLAYNWNYQTEWRIDDDGRIYVGDTYLRVTTSGYFNVTYTLTTGTRAQATLFEIVTNNGEKQIRMKNNTSRYIGWREQTSGGNITRSAVITDQANRRATYNELSHAFAENIGSYTFLIYDKTGTKVEKKETISGTTKTVSIDGLNNDAVKIGVIGTGLVKGNVIMQALDPYIDRLDIVCQEEDGNGGKLTQQFNSTDFSVRGGKFTFYVPEEFVAPAKFTFENLYSQYGDNTYYNETSSTNHARYFFVGSTYGDTNANVYNRSESATYDTKVACLQPGDKPFVFNNAATATSTTGNEYEEYPFSKALYASKVNGQFTDFTFSQAEMTNGTTKTAYLFTCDETRYNIAPTTATQHVYYAYYEMTIDMIKKNYRPVFAWNKIYDKTFYSANNTDIKRDAKWGLRLTTEEVKDDQGTHSGYLTVSQILNTIQNGLPADAQNDAVQGLDPNGVNAPKTMDQILYIDGSNLMSIVENETTTSGTTTQHTVSEILTNLDKNALLYMPYGAKPNANNIAYNTKAQYGETPSFRGAGDIVIIDRYPFYAPYDIQVDGAKMAKYERTLTNQALYGDDDQHLTIVLPFDINVDGDGIHTNEDGEGSPFMLSTMNSTNSLSKKEGSEIDFYKDGADGYFTQITEKSEPNKPYVVTMQGSTGENDFKVHVKGSLVKATPDKTGVLENETASGTYKYKENNVEKTANYTFKHKGTYTGIEIGEDGNGGAATASTTVFYFANNFFLDSKTLINEKSLKMLPFRSYYDYTGTGAGAKMARFRIVFGVNPNMGDTNGINEIQRDADLAVIPGDGCITLMARAQKNVTIHAVSGITIDKCSLNAGETRTVAVPAGVYVINGVKMVVK